MATPVQICNNTFAIFAYKFKGLTHSMSTFSRQVEKQNGGKYFNISPPTPLFLMLHIAI